MPKARGAPRTDESPLTAMTNAELSAVAYFSNLVADSGEVTFTATPAQMAEAWRTLRAREAAARDGAR
jgi:hypothetical protein